MLMKHSSGLVGYVHQLGLVYGWSVVRLPNNSWEEPIPLEWGKAPDNDTALARMEQVFAEYNPATPTTRSEP